MSKELAKVITLGKRKYNAVWLRTVSEQKAVQANRGEDHNQVRNAWKQANGKSVRNHTIKEGKADKKVTEEKK